MKRMIGNRGKSAAEQAAEWYVELGEPPPGDDLRRQFFAWLKQSPRHIEEFLAIAELERCIRAQSTSIDELVAEVKSAAGRQPVAIVGELVEAPKGLANRSGSRRRWHLAALASAAGIAAVAALLLARSPAVDTPAAAHRTELGEQKSIALRDGSIMTLNTLSEASVQFDDSTRRVTLVNGEAMFEVVRDPQRPFVVESGQLSVSVVGTKFSVYRKGRSTRIAVVEGIVSASANGDAASDIELHGGEGAVFEEEGELRRDATFDLERAVAWTERRLVFENTRLAEVVREFNRYNRMQLQIDDAQLADTPVTIGVNAHDVSALVAFLQLQPDIEVEYRADTIRIGTVDR